MSESLVHELQREAYNSNSKLTDILRKSYVVARKLKINEFEEWLNKELNGYTDFEEIPEYRESIGKVEAFNPYRGWIPVLFEDDAMAEQLNKSKTSQPISELEDLVSNTDAHLLVQLPQETQSYLAKSLNYHTEFRVIFGKSQLQRTLDTVRNIVLEWALKLEEDGIFGEGLSFSKGEKQEASKNDYTVTNFYGPTTGVQIQQNTNNSTQTMSNGLDLGALKSFLNTLNDNRDKLEIEQRAQQNIDSEISIITTEIESNNPKPEIIKQSLATIRNVLEGVTGSLIASGLLYELSRINF